MQTLNEFYYSWGPSVADFNRDGVMDIVAGPYYYLGPGYGTAKEIYLASTIDPSTQYFNGFTTRTTSPEMDGPTSSTPYSRGRPCCT